MSHRRPWRFYGVARERQSRAYLDSSDDESVSYARRRASSTGESDSSFSDEAAVVQEGTAVASAVPELEIPTSSILSDDESDITHTVEEFEEHLQHILITVHGLKGYHPDLPEKIRDTSSQVREFSYPPDSIIQEESPCLGMRDAAEKLLQEIMDIMDEAHDTSLVFLAYDIGGTVLKEALVKASKSKEYTKILEQTTLLIFLGTPHRDSKAFPWDYTLSKLVQDQFEGIPGKWLPDTIRQLAAYHNQIMTDYFTISDTFRTINYFQQHPKNTPASYPILIEPWVATLNSMNETRLDLHRRYDELGRFYTPIQVNSLTLEIENAGSRALDAYKRWRRLFSNNTFPISEPKRPQMAWAKLSEWILSSSGINDWLKENTGNNGANDIKIGMASGRTPKAPSNNHLRSIGQSWKVLNLDGLSCSTVTLSEDIRASILTQRPNDSKLQDTAINFAYSASQQRPWTRVEILAYACYRMLESRPGLVSRLQGLYSEAEIALHSFNKTCIERMLWRYLRSLLQTNVAGETYLVFHLPEGSTFSAPIQSLLHDLRDLIPVSECRFRVLVVQSANQIDSSSFDWNVDLKTPQAAAAIQHDLERSFPLDTKAVDQVLEFRQRMENLISCRPRPLQDGWELWRNPNNYSDISLYSIRTYLESGNFEKAITCVFQSIPVIYQPSVKAGLLWLTFSARFLSVYELEDVLLVHAVPNSPIVTAETFNGLLCGLVYVGSRQVHHISLSFVDRLMSMRESAVLSETSPDTKWLAFPPDPDLEIARSCVRLISTYPMEDLESIANSENSKVSPDSHRDSQNHPLLAYALEHWLTHAQRSRGEESVVHNLVVEFLSSRPRVNAWLQWIRRFADTEEPLSKDFPDPHYIAELLEITVVQAANLAMQAAKTCDFSKETAWSGIAIVLAQLNQKVALLKLADRGKLRGRSTLQRIFRFGSDDTLCSLVPKVKDFIERNANKIMKNAVLAGNTKLVGTLQEDFSKFIKYGQFSPPLLHTICHSFATSISLRSILIDTKAFDGGRAYNGTNPIHWAAFSGNHEFMLSFLDLANEEERYFFLNEGDGDGSTPLLLAAQKGHFTVASHLIHAGADTSKRNEKGRTPLHEACAEGYIDIVNCLLRRGVSMWDTDEKGNMALHLAIQNGHPGVALTLIHQASEGSTEMLSDIFPSSCKTERVVISDQRDELVSAENSGFEQHLHQHPPNIPPDASESVPTPTNASASNDQGKSTGSNPPTLDPPQVVHSVDRTGPVVNETLADPESNLISIFGKETVKDTGQGVLDVRSLISRRDELHIKPNVTEQSLPLLEKEISFHEIPDVTSSSAKFKFDNQTSEGTTALNLAAYWNYSSIVKALLKNKADITIQNLESMKRSPLHHACDYGYDHIGEMLIDELDSRNELYALDWIDDNGNTALHLAVGMGCVSLVSKLLKKNAKHDLENNINQTALDMACVYDEAAAATLLLAHFPHYPSSTIDNAFMSAARYGKHKVVEKMLRAGANPDTRDEYQNSALHITAWGLYPRALASILMRRPTLNVLDGCGGTPLHDAAKRNSLASLRMLVEAGSDVNIKNEDGYTPLYYATESPDCVRILLEAGSTLKVPQNWAAECSTFADLAVSRFSFDAFQVIIQHLRVESQRTNDKTPLVSQSCLKNLIDNADIGKIKKLEVLIQHGLKPDVPLGPDHVSLLHYAVTQENIKAVEVLSKPGRSKLNKTDSEANTFLALAAAQGTEASFQIVKCLVLAGADPTLGSKTLGPPLHAVAIMACQGGFDDKRDFYLETAAYLLNEKGSLVDVEGGYCGTALHAAAQGGSEEMVKLILFHQPRLTKVIEKYGTALHAAVDARRLDIIRRLLEVLKPEIRNSGGCLPVHYAASYDHWGPADALNRYSLPEILDPRNALLLQRDYQGRHALHFAAAHCAIKVANRILEEWHGCVNDVDCDGWSALHWASRGAGNRAAMVKLLLEKRANKSLRSHRGWKPIHTLQYHTRKRDKWDDVEQLLTTENDSTQELLSITSNLLQLPDDEEEVLPVPQAENREVKFGHHCDGCFCQIYGPRYNCLTCYDFDYCFKCFRNARMDHYSDHKFVKFGREGERVAICDPWENFRIIPFVENLAINVRSSTI